MDNTLVGDFNLLITFSRLQKTYRKSTIISTKLYFPSPKMIRLRVESFTILIFNNGKIRVMGNVGAHTIDSLNALCAYILERKVNLNHISDTIIISLDRPINCYSFAQQYSSYTKILYETELFPALSILEFAPTHVNVFHTGKIVILGKEAQNQSLTIKNWLLSRL
jgi:TATA-box binding protein (TBP) (component of TFIID and TFIIIB)